MIQTNMSLIYKHAKSKPSTFCAIKSYKKTGPIMMEPILDVLILNRLPRVVNQIVNQGRHVADADTLILVAISIIKVDGTCIVVEHVVNNT